MKKWLSKPHNIGTVCFAIVAVLAIILFVWMLKNPPSQHENNPYNAYSHQSNARAKFVPPPCVSSEDKTTRQCTERENEKYYADRSDLTAQWEAANKAHWGFYAGLLGLVLLTWTLYETLAASGELRRQTEISRTANRAEFQPYIKFSETVQVSRFGLFTDEPNELDEVFFKKQRGSLLFEVKTDITNTGKTPVLNGTFRSEDNLHWPEKTETGSRFVSRDSKSHGTIFDYIGAGETKEDTTIIHNFRIDPKDADNREMTEIEVSKYRLWLKLWVSFTDPINEYRRTFYVEYVGLLGDENLPIRTYMEVETQPEDDPNNWEGWA